MIWSAAVGGGVTRNYNGSCHRLRNDAPSCPTDQSPARLSTGSYVRLGGRFFFSVAAAFREMEGNSPRGEHNLSVSESMRPGTSCFDAEITESATRNQSYATRHGAYRAADEPRQQTIHRSRSPRRLSLVELSSDELLDDHFHSTSLVDRRVAHPSPSWLRITLCVLRVGLFCEPARYNVWRIS